MKKFLFSIIVLCVVFLQSCSFYENSLLKFGGKKSYDNYSKQIFSKLKENEPFSLNVFDNNLYRSYDVNKSELNFIKSFFEYTTTENYEEKPLDKSIKPRYELHINFKDEKFIINAYNDNLLSVYPWDGHFDKDILNMNNIPVRYNIYDFCSYIINNSYKN